VNHECRRGQGEAQAEYQARLPSGKSPPDIKADLKGAEGDLGHAESEHVAAEAAKLVEPDFETDHEQQQNDAQLGKFAQRQDSGSRYVSHLTDHDAGYQEGNDRTDPEPFEGKQTRRYQAE
jgi:hypothetical protein